MSSSWLQVTLALPVDVGRVLGAGYSDGGVPDSLHWGPQLDPEGLLVVFLPTAHPDMCTRLLPRGASTAVPAFFSLVCMSVPMGT